MNAGELCNRDVVVCEPELSVVEASRQMRDFHVGTLIVVERERGAERPIGMITDRDLVVEVLADVRAQPREIAVGDVMSDELVTSRDDESVDEVLRRMKAFGVRRMPVVKADGTLVGIVTYDDLLGWLTQQLGDLLRVVRNEVYAEELRH